MATRKKLSDPNLYTVAWVAALPIERAAAIALFDDRHDEPEHFHQHENDANAYDWGEIGQHNVVIASLPSGIYGTTSAATTATHLLSSLPHIRIGLLVGIGGGIPRPGRDIRLGDIVVSRPNGRNGGVIQYDQGAAEANNTWQRRGALNLPPPVLLNAVGKLQANHEFEDPGFIKLLEDLVIKYPRAKKHYVNQGEENDRLFKSEYDHVGGSTCDACDSSQEVERASRETTDPVVHYGTVASGNTLVKDAAARDSISRLVGEECLCVEMEAAGLVNNFPCLVIRGICDYADSHKNDRWQRYASATAAAFAVELLGCVPARQLQDAPRALAMMRSIDHKITNMKESMDSSYSKTALDRLPTARGAAHDSSDSWLQPVCLEHTRVDVLREIHDWAIDPSSTTLFWLNGMAGTGKSTISRTVARRLVEVGALGGSFFFKKGEKDRANPSKLFTTLAAGLSRWQSAVSRHIVDAIDENCQIFDQMPHQQFSKLILEPLSKAKLCCETPIVMVIDALDECQHDSITSIITDILPRARDLQHIRLKFFLTSRPELPIQTGFPSIGRRSIYQDMILQNVPQNVIKKDLETFLTHTIEGIRNRYNDGSITLPQDWPGNDAIACLVNMAMPLFIVASTICLFLNDWKLGDPKNQLDKILAVQDRTHASLDQMYLAVLNQQFRDEYTVQQKNQIVDEFRRIVGPIILLSAPLTIPALARLLYDGQDIERFQKALENRLELLRSVLNVPPHSERSYSSVRVLHLSFRDFLVDDTHRDRNPFWIDESSTHALLAQNCLRVMSTLRENVCELEHPGIQRTAIDQETVDRCLPSHVQYACLYWIDHMEQAQIDSTTGDKILTFLEVHLLHWLEALSLIGGVLGAEEMIERLKHMTMHTGCLRLSEFLDDSIRFTGANVHGIDTAPLQVYSSALVFAPLKSVVRTTFHTQIPEWISLQPRVENEWDNCLQSFYASEKEISWISFSPDSELVAVVSVASELCIWDVKTGKELLYIAEEDELFDSVDFTADSNMILAMSEKCIRVWDLITEGCIQKLRYPHSKITVMRPLAPDLIAYGSKRGGLRIWRAETGQLLFESRGHRKPVRALAASTDEQLLASGSDDGTIIIWKRDRDTWDYVKTLKSPGNGGICRIAFSDDSDLIAAAISNTVDTDDSEDPDEPDAMDVEDNTDGVNKMDDDAGGTLVIFAVGPDQKHRVLSHYRHLPDLMFRPGLILVVSDPSHLTISVWQADTGQLLHELRGGMKTRAEDHIVTAISSDSTLAISTLDKDIVEVWGIDARKCLERYDRHDGNTVVAVAMSPDGRSVLSATDDGIIKVWEFSPRKEKSLQGPEDDPGFHKAISPDFRLTASYMPKPPTLKILETATGSFVHSFNIPDFPKSAMFSADSKFVLSVCKLLLIWTTETGTLRQAFETPSEYGFYAAAFSPTSERVVAACSEGIRIWQVGTGECTQMIEWDCTIFSTLLAFSPDSTWILAAKPGVAEVWDITTGKQLLTMEIVKHGYMAVAISEDKKLVALASEDATIEIWQLSTCKCLGMINSVDTSHNLSFEADDTQLLTSNGLIGLDTACSPEQQVTDLLQHGEIRIGIGKSKNNQWITWHGRRLLLIPNIYDFIGAVKDSSVLLKSDSWRAVVITFDPHKLASMYSNAM